MKKVLLVGFGEIGSSVFKLIKEEVDVTILDPYKGFKVKPNKFDYMVVTIPYSENFVETVNTYRLLYGIEYTIIHSTVQIGTTKQIPKAIHIPVEGKHPNLAESMREFTRFIGYNEDTCLNVLDIVIDVFGFDADFFFIQNSNTTEFLKLQSTTNYGLMIEYARYLKEVAEKLGIDYKYVKEYNKAYNNLYNYMEMPQYQRYILDPPKGNIGGHCVVPNAKLLDELFPDEFLKRIYSEKEV